MPDGNPFFFHGENQNRFLSPFFSLQGDEILNILLKKKIFNLLFVSLELQFGRWRYRHFLYGQIHNKVYLICHVIYTLCLYFLSFMACRFRCCFPWQK